MKNTMSYAQILDLPDNEACSMAEECLQIQQDSDVENILNNFYLVLDEEDKETLAEFIVETQNLMPNI